MLVIGIFPLLGEDSSFDELTLSFLTGTVTCLGVRQELSGGIPQPSKKLLEDGRWNFFASSFDDLALSTPTGTVRCCDACEAPWL